MKRQIIASIYQLEPEELESIRLSNKLNKEEDDAIKGLLGLHIAGVKGQDVMELLEWVVVTQIVMDFEGKKEINFRKGKKSIYDELSLVGFKGKCKKQPY